MSTQTRRRMLALMSFSALAGRTPAEEVTRKPATVRDRRYRADATISFLGITIYTRTGVGAGTVHVEQNDNSDGSRSVALRFTAGSEPARARGLNRLGYIEELVVERNSAPLEAAYFGFMTSSPEKNLDQAKAALGPAGKDAVPYAAVEGSASGGSASYKLYNTVLSSSYTYRHCDDVVARVRQALARNEIPPARTERTAAQCSRTFLYAVREAMAARERRVSTPFLYNGKQFRLEAASSQDTRAAQQFASRKLPVAPGPVFRMNGTIHDPTRGDSTAFRLWFQQGSDLPIRFEYRPRSFLQLAFEWVQG